MRTRLAPILAVGFGLVIGLALVVAGGALGRTPQRPVDTATVPLSTMELLPAEHRPGPGAAAPPARDRDRGRAGAEPVSTRGAAGRGRPRTAFGVLLVLAYGVGMAATLAGAGLLLLAVQRRLARITSRTAGVRWVNRLRSLAERLGAATPAATAALVLAVGAGLALRAATPWSDRPARRCDGRGPGAAGPRIADRGAADRGAADRRIAPGHPVRSRTGTLPGMKRVAVGMQRVAVVLVLLLGALAGCRQAPADPGFPAPAPDRTPPATPAQVTYAFPADFIETDDYRPGHLYFPAPALEFLIPADALGQFDNLDVITIISYLMDVDVGDWPEERIIDLVRRLVARVGSPVAEPERIVVAGRPAYTLPVVERSPLGRRLTYQSTFIVDRTYLVQLQCQYERRQQLIEQACAQLHESLEITAR